jgi:hypothetical protein
VGRAALQSTLRERDMAAAKYHRATFVATGSKIVLASSIPSPLRSRRGLGITQLNFGQPALFTHYDWVYAVDHVTKAAGAVI